MAMQTHRTAVKGVYVQPGNHAGDADGILSGASPVGVTPAAVQLTACV